MREILFRGKRIDNGEWIQGDLVQFPAHGVVRIVKQEPPYGDAEVDSDTVGQFIGLTDKNGKRIFEGDIVDYNGSLHKVVFESRNNNARFGIVIDELETWDFSAATPPDMMIVVGNIHDDPDLLEVDK